LLLEPLESRRLLATMRWDGGGDGVAWNDPLNWDTDDVPGSSDEAVVDVAGDVTVTLNGSTTIQSLVNAETIRLIGETLSITQSASNTGTISVEGDPSQSAQLGLAGREFTNDGLIELRGSGGDALLHLESDTTFSGTGQVLIAPPGTGENARIRGAQGVTLTVGPEQTVRGRGEIQVDVVNKGLIETPHSYSVTSITGSLANEGTVRATGEGQLTISAAVTNTGTLDLAGDYSTMTLSGGLTNSGVVQFSGSGRLELTGEVSSTTDLGVSTGGTLRFSTATVNVGGFAVTADGGTVEVGDSSITDGTLRVTDSASSFVQFDGDVMLNDVMWEDLGVGEFRIYRTTARFLGDYASRLPDGCTLVVQTEGSDGSAGLALTGGQFRNDGTIELRGGLFTGGIHNDPLWATLSLESNLTLTGNGQILMSPQPAMITGSEGSTLTIAEGQAVLGAGEIQVDVVNKGLIETSHSSIDVISITGSVRNEGTLRAAGEGDLTVSGAVTNAGTVEVVDEYSRMTLSGGLANSGVVQVSAGGKLELKGMINSSTNLGVSSGGTLRFSSATVNVAGSAVTAEGGTVEVADSSISDGTLWVSDDPSSFVQFSGDVRMNGVTWEDPGAGEFRVYRTTARFLGDYGSRLPQGRRLVVDAGSYGEGAEAQLSLPGGVFQNDGIIELRGGSHWHLWTLHPDWAVVWFESDATLTGTGQLLMAPAGTGETTRISGAEGAVVTVGAEQVIRGQGEILTDVANEGVIEADPGGSQLSVTGAVTNVGTLRATGGGRFIFSGEVSSTGTLEVEGGTLQIDGLTG